MGIQSENLLDTARSMPAVSVSAPARAGYHHGDLPAALRAAAIDIIEIIRQAAGRLAGPGEVENLTLAAVAVAQGFALLSASTGMAAGASAKMAARARQAATVLARNAIGSHPACLRA